MALQATTLTNSSAGSQTPTDNSHDGSLLTWDRFSFNSETVQYGFSGAPVDWKKFRFQYYCNDVTLGALYIYIIPTGVTNPASYTLVYSSSALANNGDITYEHGSTISADGIYIKVVHSGDASRDGDFKEVECWDEAGAVGWTHKINSIAPENMAKVNSVAKADITKINQT